MKFRLPICEFILILIVLGGIFAIQFSSCEQVIGEPMILDGTMKYLVAIRGHGVDLRDQQGKSVMYWSWPPEIAQDEEGMKKYLLLIHESLSQTSVP